MNREIKFRGKSIKKNEWVYGSYHQSVGTMPIDVSLFDTSGEKKIKINCHWILERHLPQDLGWSIEDTYFGTRVEEETVGQFTGLKDKNGVEIFEGDKVSYVKKTKYCSCPAEVELEYLSAKFCPGCGRLVEEKEFQIECEVKFYNGSFCLYKLITEGRFTAWPMNIADIYIIDKKVIGNIHDNPELLS